MIYLVDDAPSLLQAFALELNAMGVPADFITDAQAAYARLTSTPLGQKDIILVDLMLNAGPNPPGAPDFHSAGDLLVGKRLVEELLKNDREKFHRRLAMFTISGDVATQEWARAEKIPLFQKQAGIACMLRDIEIMSAAL